MRPEHLNLLYSPSGPAVHPDGTWAAIAITHPDLEKDTYPSGLWRLDLADGSLRPLTHGTGDSAPVISPDGQYLAFLRAGEEGEDQLALMRTDGGEPQVLTDHPIGVGGRPEFSPDSARIAYAARVPEEGRYGTSEGVGPGAEPPRHITRFTYRMDGLGFAADRPRHLYVIDVPVQDDPTAPPVGGSAAADDGEAGRGDGGTRARRAAGGTAGAGSGQEEPGAGARGAAGEAAGLSAAGGRRDAAGGADAAGSADSTGELGSAGEQDSAREQDGEREQGGEREQDGAREQDGEDLPAGAREGVPVRPVQLTSGDRDYRDPVWDHDGTHLLAIRGVVDELRGEVIRVLVAAGAAFADAGGVVVKSADADRPAGSGPEGAGGAGAGAGADAGVGVEGGDAGTDPGAEVEVLDGPEHGASLVRTGPGQALWLLASDLGDDAMDFIGKTPALYSARLTAEGLSDLQRRTDPHTESFNGAVFLVADEADDSVPGNAGAAGDGQVLLTRTHRGSTELVWYAGGQVQPVFTGQVSVSGAALLPGGDVLITAATPGSVGEVFLLDGAGDRASDIGVQAAAPDPAGAAVAADGFDQPVRRLTNLSARLREQAQPFVPQELQVDSDDGYPVHGWVTVPDGQGPHPVLLLIHGGPYAQYESVLFDEVQVYTRAGYAVVFCNPRGSLGYGQEHGRAITGAFGDRDAADVLAFLDGALAAHPSLDGERAGVLGGSYGGYLTAWLTTRTDRFTAAIVERGFLDPVSFEGSSDIGWFFGLKYLGTDPEQVAAQSPMAHIDKVTTPTLVIHSEHDWRCPVEQGQRWFVGLKRRGVQAEFLLFPGEGHELSRSGRPKHRKARFDHILAWWQRHLPVT